MNMNESLLDAAADVNAQANSGRTALPLAMEKGHAENMEAANAIRAAGAK